MPFSKKNNPIYMDSTRLVSAKVKPIINKTADAMPDEMIREKEMPIITEDEKIIKKIDRQKLNVMGFLAGAQSGITMILPKVTGIKPAFKIGISGEIEFNKRFRLGLSLDKNNMPFKVVDSIALLNLPPKPVMNDAYSLEYIEGNVKSWQIGTNVRYFFKPDAVINPFISVGYVFQINSPFEVEFEYINKKTQEHISFDITNENAPRTNHLWTAGIGTEIHLFKNIYGRTNVNYMHNFNANNTNVGYWFLQGGFFYRW